MNKIVTIVGATGYLGQYLVEEFINKGYKVNVIVRSIDKIKRFEKNLNKIHVINITKAKELTGLLKGSDIVVSSLGITRQKDNMTYMDVDYRCNQNVLEEAIISHVDKFMYISAFKGQEMKHLKIMEAKEKFVESLKAAPIKSYIIRPSGFFVDIAEVLTMAKKGRVYLFGNGLDRSNPIHGKDLARFCEETIHKGEGTFSIGGPEVLTQKEIAVIGFSSLSKRTKITYIPKSLGILTRKALTIFTNQKFYGPIEFFLTVLTIDMVAPQYGEKRLKDYFDSL